ncbi:hypothetical protein C5167_037830, partial [Papaver somniferum]
FPDVFITCLCNSLKWVFITCLCNSLKWVKEQREEEEQQQSGLICQQHIHVLVYGKMIVLKSLLMIKETKLHHLMSLLLILNATLVDQVDVR